MNARLNRFCGIYGPVAGGAEQTVRDMGQELDPAVPQGTATVMGPLTVLARYGLVVDGIKKTLWLADGDDEFRQYLERRDQGKSSGLPDTLTDASLARSLRDIPGGWSLAALDADGNLLLARDRIGRRELYYTRLGERLCFATGMRPLLNIDGQRPGVRQDKISEYMAFRLIAGPETLLQDVCRVLPGEALVFTSASPQPAKIRYWFYAWQPDAEPIGVAEAAQELERRLTAGVNGALEGRRVFLMQSAGMDSNAILAVARQSPLADLSAVTIAPDAQGYSEAEQAGKLAAFLQCRRHETLPVTGADLAVRMFEAHRVMEEPVAHVISILHTAAYEFKQGAYEGFLTGEAADVMLGNNRAGKYARCLRYGSWPPTEWALRHLADMTGVSKLHVAAAICGSDWRRFVCRSRMVLDDESLGRLVKDYNPHFAARLDILEPYGVADRLEGICRYFFESAVHCCKSFAVLAGHWDMEPFFVFLRKPILDWIAGLNAECRFGRGYGKYALRKAMENRLPRETVWGDKRAGEQPLGEWFRRNQVLKSLACSLLNQDTRMLGYFHPDEIRAILRRHFDGTRDESVAIWQLVSLEIWYRLVIENADCETVSKEMLALMRKV